MMLDKYLNIMEIHEKQLFCGLCNRLFIIPSTYYLVGSTNEYGILHTKCWYKWQVGRYLHIIFGFFNFITKNVYP